MILEPLTKGNILNRVNSSTIAQVGMLPANSKVTMKYFIAPLCSMICDMKLYFLYIIKSWFLQDIAYRIMALFQSFRYLYMKNSEKSSYKLIPIAS